MASWQAWVLDAMFRLVMKRHGDKPLDLDRSRRLTNNPPRRALHIPDGMKVEEIVTPEGLRFDVADSAGPRSGQPPVVLLYLHGGGYFFGSPKTHRPIVITLARSFAAPCYALDYRLAPEHPFPAAVEDAAKAWDWLIARHPGARILLSGDSAGGGLALALAMGARAAGKPSPAAMVLLSPWTDMAVTGASVEANARSCAMFRPRGIREAAAMYVGAADPRDPRASPLYGDLGGLPPMLLFASNSEALLDDTLRLAERAKAAGVAVELVRRDGLPHVWPIFVRLIPEAREAVREIEAFGARLGLVGARPDGAARPAAVASGR
jgi:acetyl esterase/lipase